MGNHEDMIMSGELMYAAETLVSYDALQMPEDVLEWMRSLPKYYEDDTIIVAHAGAVPGRPMNEQNDTYLLWYRYQDWQNANLGKHFYHGHTPKLGKVETMSDRTNVDTACVYGGHLTAAIVGDDGKPEGFIQVPAQHSVYV
jgi:serine/threonine protein phosphatase 1